MSIKLGSGTLNKIMLGNTLINKVYLGGNIIYPNGTPPPSSTLLDGFETISGGGPWTSTLTWIEATGLSTMTVSRTSSHITQGSFTWRLQDTTVFGNSGIIVGSGTSGSAVNLMGYTVLSVDFFGVTIPPSASMIVQVVNSDFTDFVQDLSPEGTTGAVTINVDLSTASFDLSNVNVLIGITSSSPELSSDYYIDNFRASS